MNINGLTTKIDVLTAIKESVQAQRQDMAIDMLDQLIELEQPKKSNEDTFYPDANDQHLIRQNFNKAIGGK